MRRPVASAERSGGLIPFQLQMRLCLSVRSDPYRTRNHSPANSACRWRIACRTLAEMCRSVDSRIQRERARKRSLLAAETASRSPPNERTRSRTIRAGTGSTNISPGAGRCGTAPSDCPRSGLQDARTHRRTGTKPVPQRPSDLGNDIAYLLCGHDNFAADQHCG